MRAIAFFGDPWGYTNAFNSGKYTYLVLACVCFSDISFPQLGLQFIYIAMSQPIGHSQKLAETLAITSK